MDKVTGTIVNKKSITGRLDMPSGGVKDYNLLNNKPSIENVTLVGNHVMADFGDRSLSNMDIQSIIDSVFN